MHDELAIVNSSNAFWQALDSNFSQASCVHDHGQGEQHFHMAGNFLIAQKKIQEAIGVVFGEGFDVKNPEHRDHLITLSAIQKAQDQLSGGDDFVSHRTSDFNKHFKISDSLAGKNLDGAIFSMPNAKKYLVNKFNLSSTRAKADVIFASREAALTKAGQLVDLGSKNVTDHLVEVAGSIYKAAPSLAVAGLTLGTAQMIMRSCGDQESANMLRDNIGASTEAAAFFVLVNGVLENLSHSFILAAPAFATVAVYDSAYSKLKPIYDHCIKPAMRAEQSNPVNINDIETQLDTETQQTNNTEELPAAEESIKECHLSGSFENGDLAKTLNLLKRTKSLINEDEMWIGLRKHQLVYRDNNLEDDLKSGLESLILELREKPNQINKLLQEGHKKTLRDSFEMLKSYAEVYEDKNPASGVGQFLNEFCDHFARDAILLNEPSKEAKMAAFYCRSYNGLVSFEERVKESLPHMPTGQQMLLAATVIGALYSASAIYKASTGEEEVYSDYVTNFPDHLFEWLHLDQMYQNMGGGAELTESFKDFFAGFNLAENSTHLGIAVAPFAAYAQRGSKMLDGITHAPANYLAYAADLTSSYVTATKAVVGGWFSKGNSIPVAPEVDIARVEEDVEVIDLEIVPDLIDQSTQTDVPGEKKSEEDASMMFCSVISDQTPSQSQAQQKERPSRKPRNASIFHIHGPQCNHHTL